MDERFAGHWDERIAAHWQEHAPALTRLRDALDRVAAALAPTEDDRARLEAFLCSDSAPRFWNGSSYTAINPDRVDLAALVQAYQELSDAGAALPRPPGCPMEEFKYDGLPVDLLQRYYGTVDQVWAVVGAWPMGDDAEVSRGMARILTGSDKASFSTCSGIARRKVRKPWPLIGTGTWRHRETRLGTGWFHPTVVALECPRGHRLELPEREALKDYGNAMSARTADPDISAEERGFEAWIPCPECSRSYPWVLRVWPPGT